MLCQTEKIAPGTVAMGICGKVLDASEVARPEFCIPISIETAFFLGMSILNRIPIRNPHRYPNRLCRITIIKIVNPVDRIFSLLCDTTAATIRHIAVTYTVGSAKTIF